MTAECNKPASDTVSDERGAEKPAIAPTGNAEHGSEALQSEDCVLDGILFLRLCDEIRDHERDEVLMAYALTRNAGYTADEISDLWQAELDKLYPSHPADLATYLAESSNTGTAGPIKENDHSIAADAGPLSQNEGGSTHGVTVAPAGIAIGEAHQSPAVALGASNRSGHGVDTGQSAKRISGHEARGMP